MQMRWCLKTTRVFLFCFALIASRVAFGQKSDKHADILRPVYIEANRLTGSSWGLQVDISPREIQCAKNAVTVMVTVDETGHQISNIDVSVKSQAVVQQRSFFGTNLIGEVALEPAANRGDKCEPETSATLTVTLDCPTCSSIAATFRFFQGPAIASIQSGKLTAVDVTQPASDTTRTLRCFTEVDKRLLVENRAFTAVVEFPAKEGQTISNFAARPRTLLINENSWYLGKITSMTVSLVLGLQIPHLSDETKIPQIVLDIECQGCDPDAITLRYNPEYRSGAYEMFMKAQEVLQSSVVVKAVDVLPTQPCPPDSAYCSKIIIPANDFCGYTSKGVVDVTSRNFVKVDFWWMFETVRYDATVYKAHNRRIVSWSPNSDVDPCSQLEKTVYLVASSQDEFSLVAQMLHLVEPKKEPGSSLARANSFTGSWQGPDVCKIKVNKSVENKIPAGITDVYYTDRVSLSRVVKSKDTPVDMIKNKLEASRILTAWEQKILEKPLANEWELTGGSETLCLGVTGVVHAYYRIDASSVANENVKVASERHLGPNDDKDLAVKIFPKLNESGAVDRWLISTALIQTTRAVFCKGQALRYEITQLPDQETAKPRVSASSDWIVDQKEQSRGRIVVAVTTKTKCAAASELLHMELICDGPCHAPVVNVMREDTSTRTPATPTTKSTFLPATTIKPSSGVTTDHQSPPPGFAMLTNIAQGRLNGNRAEFTILDAKKRAELIAPFVVIFCLSAEKVESIKSVSVAFVELSPIESFKHKNAFVRCFAFDSLAASSIALAEPLTVVVSGDMVPPRNLNYSLESATKFETLSKESQYTSKDHGGWYGPVQERSKYSFSDGVVEVRIRTEPGHGLVLATDSSVLSSVRGIRKESSSPGSLVYVRPPFGLTASTNIVYKSGALFGFGINTLVSAFTLAILSFSQQRR